MQTQDEDLISLAKERVLGKVFGMFDLVEGMLAEADIINMRPRLLREKIARLLQIRIEDIPYKSFCSWIDRCRKRHKKRNQPLSIKANTVERPTNGRKSLENFKAIVPVREEDNEPILKKVYNKP